MLLIYLEAFVEVEQKCSELKGHLRPVEVDELEELQTNTDVEKLSRRLDNMQKTMSSMIEEIKEIKASSMKQQPQNVSANDKKQRMKLIKKYFINVVVHDILPGNVSVGVSVEEAEAKNKDKATTGVAEELQRARREDRL